jgi:hypothetical protein
MEKKLLSLFVICCFLSSASIISGNQIKKNNDPDISSLSVGENDIALMLEQLDEDMFLGYVEYLVAIAEKYEEARFTGTDGCEEARYFLVQEFANMRMDVRSYAWTAFGTFFPYNLNEYSSYNIEARLEGTSNSDKYYIISAHYDTVYNTPGADDNSAGVAAVLCAAKILSQYEFNHEIRFICWSGEEQGLLGSNAYAYEKYENNDNLIATINLDMMGYTSDEIEGDEYKVMIYETCSDRLIGTAIEVSQNPKYSPHLNLEVVPSEDDSGHGSDQRSFCKYAQDAIFIHEYTWNDEKDTSGDTIENLDINYATRVARLAMGTIATWASSPVISNTPPEKPQTPNGPDDAQINVLHTFTTSTADADGDQVYYLFDWGDGSNSKWVGPLNSGEIGHASHMWTKQGEYKIRVKAKDEHGIQSGWSETPKLTFSKPSIFSSLFEKHKIVYQIFIKLAEYFNN